MVNHFQKLAFALAAVHGSMQASFRLSSPPRSRAGKTLRPTCKGNLNRAPKHFPIAERPQAGDDLAWCANHGLDRATGDIQNAAASPCFVRNPKRSTRHGDDYRLTPINLEHESWKRSKVKKQAVRVLAHDCADARSKVAKATEILEEIEFQSPRGRFAPLVYEKLPWELSDVTSCEPDDSGAPMPANDIVTEDGSQFPIHR
jgi:hypothetical protein